MKKKSTRLNRWKAAICAAAVVGSAAMAGPAHAGSGPIVTPASLDFGNVPSASTSAVQTLTVTSSYGGPSSIMVDTLVIPPGYARSGGSCPIGSAVTSPCTIGIVFQPPSPGILAGNIAITATSNGFLSGTTNVPATGNGVAFRVVPALSNLGLLLLLAGLGGVGSVVARRR